MRIQNFLRFLCVYHLSLFLLNRIVCRNPEGFEISLNDQNKPPITATGLNSTPIVDNLQDPNSTSIVDNPQDPNLTPIVDNLQDPNSTSIVDNPQDPNSTPIVDNPQDLNSTPIVGTPKELIQQMPISVQAKSIKSDNIIKHSISAPYSNRYHLVPWNSFLGIINILLCILIICFAGFTSGIILGYMALDPVYLTALRFEIYDSNEKETISDIIQIVKNHHLLLVSLLIANAFVIELLPIVMSNILPAYLSIIISMAAIVLFGEIFPQAICTGQYQMKIIKTTLPFVKILISLLFVISWPIAKLLDYLLGSFSHETVYARSHIKAILHIMQRQKKALKNNFNELSNEKSLVSEEVAIMEGALKLSEITAEDIMLPLNDVFMLEANYEMTNEAFELILSKGHSRIPVYSSDRNQIKGIILTKSLILAPTSINLCAGDLIVERQCIFVTPESNLYVLLREFRKGISHIAFVTRHVENYRQALMKDQSVEDFCCILGIVTLEDLIEELIQEEIYDEFDRKIFYPKLYYTKILENSVNSKSKKKPIRTISKETSIQNTAILKSHFDSLTKPLMF